VKVGMFNLLGPDHILNIRLAKKMHNIFF